MKKEIRMKETRGMKIVREKLTPEEIGTRLRDSIKSQLSFPVKRKKPLTKPARAKLTALVEMIATKAENGHIANRRRALEKGHSSDVKRCDLRDFYDPDDKAFVKKYKMGAAKCLGTSRKKCPECADGRVKIWPMPFGKRRLLCSTCGWTDVRTDGWQDGWKW